MNSNTVGVIILTFNSKKVIEQTIRAAKQVSRDIIVVDSGSTDGTPEIATALGCQVLSRAFKHYADQRNWAIETHGNRFAWQLHLDADEKLDQRAINSLRSALAAPGHYVGFLLRRRVYFMGVKLRFGGTSSWHLRLFMSGGSACEDRLYDQHFICNGPVRKLDGWLEDMNVGTLSEWIARHNRWSDLEVSELLRPTRSTGHVLEPSLSGDPRNRRRFYKTLYYKVPLGARAVLYFLFRYVVRLGFLDGRAGFLFAFFQALWFRMLVDAKLFENRVLERS